MLRRTFCLTLATLAIAAGCQLAVADDRPYTQTQNVVYAETDGVGLVMDIFTPTGTPNGLAIVDVVSGAWYSDRGKIEQHRMAKMYDIFCGRGYTVFGVRPGSKTQVLARPKWPSTSSKASPGSRIMPTNTTSIRTASAWPALRPAGTWPRW